ncbi:hypothetical protein EH183_35505 [Streptomyces sp. CB01881]|nr:hypothetical protein C2142_35440 [Streptomyces sp. CB01881]TYC69774.1 hypothetical protein EH183_35505 [Streptomyces sp. CB01881]
MNVQAGCQPTNAAAAATMKRIQELGFELLGKSGVPGREYLHQRSGPPVNVHVVGQNGRLWNDNMLFRDLLRAHPDVAARYRAGQALRRAKPACSSPTPNSERAPSRRS